ncbi:CKLF-like MARVEL transmembrane domain-containing protein 6 [Notolabrus celidotus]|uniref:CKLF-like MARVEL transmembrane domain-containing protein 6 n=1 Tax=Notolabrus celidotus TaxID=1203425 RepID=UPI00148F5A56|nr:CKLF-like MARVEL transmembrane domain-containing protein 6 [Notolabrus celidotus]
MTSTVYSSTTESNPKSSWCLVPSEYLDKPRFVIKVCQVLLSFLAFILEEVVNSCVSCTALYFFEFVSCTAFLFTLMLLILLSSPLYSRVGVASWPLLDFLYTAGIALLFLIASSVFASDNGKTSVESCAVAFGFLATLAFLLDLALFYKSNGFPIKSKDGAPPSNGVSAQDGPAEKEKLNAVANGTEEV